MIKLYNTYTKTKEDFKPLKEGFVGMYGCGVTPYKPAHLGHAMQAVIFDVIRRYFEHKGYNVTYVRNYTDVDDKIIKAALELGISPLAHAKNIINQNDADFDKLRIRRADIEPKVSENIQEIIELTQRLIDKEMAYATTAGNVYYKVRNFANYGKLSNQKIDDLLNGTRKEVEADKKDPLDFALWKTAGTDEIFWESPWGKGRPGWHIECSAMSNRYLGDHFDIHGGGEDLVFPHHENEIAQSAAAHHGEFANYWLHNGLLMVGNEKMSKSLGNDISIKTWLENYHPETIRYLILTNHYRSHVQFVSERYAEATEKVYTIYNLLGQAENITQHTNMDARLYNGILEEFENYMDNDFNTVQVVALLNRIAKEITNQLVAEKNRKPEVLKSFVEGMKKIGSILGLFDLDPIAVLREMKALEIKKRGLNVKDIENQLDSRKSLRAEGKYKEADQVRMALVALGIKIQDTQHTTEWDFDFSSKL